MVSNIFAIVTSRYCYRSTDVVISGGAAGLAGVTPVVWIIDVQSSLIAGIIAGIAPYYAAILIKERLKIDDARLM